MSQSAGTVLVSALNLGLTAGEAVSTDIPLSYPAYLGTDYWGK